MGFPRKLSLRSSAVIGNVIRNGKSYVQDPLKLHVMVPEDSTRNLFAFAVPRYGHTIVERNRLKRRLQEIVRLAPLPDKGLLAVLRCRPGAYGRDYGELKSDYDRLVSRISAELR